MPKFDEAEMRDLCDLTLLTAEELAEVLETELGLDAEPGGVALHCVRTLVSSTGCIVQ